MRPLLLFVAMLSIALSGTAAVAPSITTNFETHVINQPGPFPDFLSMKLKDVRKILGRKLTLKEKIAFKVFQWKLKKGHTVYLDNTKSKKGQLAMILGIVGLVTLFIPYVTIVSLPLAILAIVFGNQARNANPKDRQAKTGVLLGWITIGLLIALLVITIAILSSFFAGLL